MRNLLAALLKVARIKEDRAEQSSLDSFALTVAPNPAPKGAAQDAPLAALEGARARLPDGAAAAGLDGCGAAEGDGLHGL
jgi:hypothetical protein